MQLQRGLKRTGSIIACHEVTSEQTTRIEDFSNDSIGKKNSGVPEGTPLICQDSVDL